MPKPSLIERTVRDIATSLPGVTQGIACEGTSLESTTFAAGTKTFVFLRRTEQGWEVRLKLNESRAAAAARENVTIGANGWAKLTFDDASAPLEHLRRWITESHAALTAKPPGKPPGKKTPAKKTSAKKAPGRKTPAKKTAVRRAGRPPS